jgi:hypothetical protein
MDRRVKERPRFGILQCHRHRRDSPAKIEVFVGGFIEATGGGGEIDAPQAQDEVFERGPRDVSLLAATRDVGVFQRRKLFRSARATRRRSFP